MGVRSLHAVGVAFLPARLPPRLRAGPAAPRGRLRRSGLPGLLGSCSAGRGSGRGACEGGGCRSPRGHPSNRGRLGAGGAERGGGGGEIARTWPSRRLPPSPRSLPAAGGAAASPPQASPARSGGRSSRPGLGAGPGSVGPTPGRGASGPSGVVVVVVGGEGGVGGGGGRGRRAEGRGPRSVSEVPGATAARRGGSSPPGLRG